MSGCEVVIGDLAWSRETCPQPVVYEVDLAPFADERHAWVTLCAEHTARLRREITEDGVILAVRTHR